MKRDKIRQSLNGLRITEIETDPEIQSHYLFTLSSGDKFSVDKESIFDEDGIAFEDDTD